jgi:hypothetical protein
VILLAREGASFLRRRGRSRPDGGVAAWFTAEEGRRWKKRREKKKEKREKKRKKKKKIEKSKIREEK